MRGGLTSRMFAASLALCALVAAAFILLVTSIQELRRTSDLTQRAAEVLVASGRLQKLVLDVQTGQRGFILTGQDELLQPWRSGRAEFPGAADDLKRLVIDPNQERRARGIVDAGSFYIEKYSTPLVELARTDREKARAIVVAGRGTRLMEAIRARFSDFDAAENKVAAERRRRSNADAHRAIVFGLAGLGGSVLLILLFAGYLARLIVVPVRRVASAAERLAHGDLSARVPEDAAAEVGQLARSFNTMASSLEESRDELENQNAELELQTVELEDQQTRLASANDELEAQQAELEAQQAELEGALVELAQEKERIELLYAFGEMLARETESDGLAVSVMRQLGDLAEADVGALYIAAPEQEYELVLATTRGIEPSRLPERIAPGRGLAGRAVAENTHIVVARGDSELTVESFGKEVRVGHEIHLPLSFGTRTLGVVSLGRLGDRPFSENQLEAFEHLAGQAAVAVSSRLAFREALRLGDINRAVLDATLDGIALANADGDLILMNAAQQRMMTDLFELPPDSTIAEYVEMMATRTTEPERLLAFAAEIARNPEYEGTDDVELLSGRSYMRYTAPVRSAHGDHIGRVYVIRETTVEREVERLKSELVATVSHELRTPLSSIMGFAELLADRDYDEATRKRFLATIHGEAARLTALVNEFLDLQRIEDGSFTLALEAFDLDALVRDEVELYSAQSEAHTLEIELPDQAVPVLGERDRIKQVLGNLLSNAIKYSPRGGVIHVRLEPSGTAVRVSITDDGVGIPGAQQGGVFSKFFRADSSDTREIGGTGLGLALCKDIVEAHSGTIGFTSVEGRGSTFWFELPSPSSSNGRRDERPVVLVVEDDPQATFLLAHYLQEADYSVVTTVTGEEALAQIAEHRPDAICLDITLAGELSGWDVLSRLKEDPATSGIPVVICTAGNGRVDASALGAADFLAKPFAAGELHAALQRVLPEGKGSVLVVDDEESVRALVIETLAGTGYELREAADGEEALERIAARRPDAIVLDLVMPKLDGFAVLERLQGDPELRLIPVIVLTARALKAAERSLLQRRAVSLLEKNNYSGEELRSLVQRAIG